MTTSPFLLALNQQKLTPFQTVRAFQKTRRLIIDQGVHKSAIKLNTDFSKQIIPASASEKVLKNPNILKLRSRQQVKMQQEIRILKK